MNDNYEPQLDMLCTSNEGKYWCNEHQGWSFTIRWKRKDGETIDVCRRCFMAHKLYNTPPPRTVWKHLASDPPAVCSHPQCMDDAPKDLTCHACGNPFCYTHLVEHRGFWYCMPCYPNLGDDRDAG